MLLDLKAFPETPMPSMLGGEGTIILNRHLDEHGKIMLVRVKPGCSIGEHVHSDNYEICYPLEGKAKARYDGVVEELVPGVVHYCPKGHSHTVYNDGTEDFLMFAVVPCSI